MKYQIKYRSCGCEYLGDRIFDNLVDAEAERRWIMATFTFVFRAEVVKLGKGGGK